MDLFVSNLLCILSLFINAKQRFHDIMYRIPTTIQPTVWKTDYCFEDRSNENRLVCKSQKVNLLRPDVDGESL